MPELIDVKWNKDALFVYWILTDYCNQSCNYCPSSLHQGLIANGVLPGLQTDKEIDKFLDYIIDFATKNDKLLIVSVSGGEPTTHKKYPEIVQRLRTVGFVETITNAARPLNWWKSLPALPQNISISLHPEYYDAKKMRINELSDFFVGKGVTLTYNLCFDPNHWDKSVAIADSIDKKFWNRIIPKPIFELEMPGTPMKAYTAEQVSYMKSFVPAVRYDPGYPRNIKSFSDGTRRSINANKIAADGLNQFKGWKCSAGSKGISIKANGNVYAGICGIELLGRLSDFKMLDEYVVCNKSVCPCPADINLDKYRD